MRKLLIIGANFPPTNAVDMHRVRTCLPYYARHGWEPKVLCFSPDSADHPSDETLVNSVPEEVQVIRVHCPKNGWTNRIGLHAAGFRGYWAMRRAGLTTIKKERPDLIFFSTTSFPLMCLGASFQSLLGVPYVLDFQDPWVSEEPSIHERRLKHLLARRLHQSLEPKAVRGAAGIMSVSPDYLGVLRRRYQLPVELPTAVVPFGAASEDIQIARRISPQREPYWPSGLVQDLNQKITGVYAGAYVKSMEPMIRALFQDVNALLESSPEWADRLRLWFIGSHYSSRVVTRPIEAIATEYGLGSVVREFPQRIPYFDSIGILCKASFVLILGSTTRAYNPSKILTYLQTSKPLFAVIQRSTFTEELLSKTGGCVVEFASDEGRARPASRSFAKFLIAVSAGADCSEPANREFSEQFSAESSTRNQSALFAEAVSYSKHRGGVGFAGFR